MEDPEWMAQRFEECRNHLTRVAFRMLGSRSEAEDAVQESWLRLSRSDEASIDNLTGWLTTVVARICLDMLRSRRARREETLPQGQRARVAVDPSLDPQQEALLADSIGPALLIVLDMLSPPERVAFVLHDTFGMPFEEIAPIVGRTEAAARQLASRARRRVRGPAPSGSPRTGTAGRPGGAPSGDDPAARAKRRKTERRVVDAFLAAARGGDFEGLLSLLDPGCVVTSDDYAALLGSPKRIDGGRKVADFFNGAASAAEPATIAGVAGAAWAPNGRVRVAFSFTFKDDRILGIEFIADRKLLEVLGVDLLEG